MVLENVQVQSAWGETPNNGVIGLRRPCIDSVVEAYTASPAPWSCSLAKALNIDHDALGKLRASVREFARGYLDFDVAVKDQTPGRWEGFIHDATVKFPIFAKFPQSWPLRDYMARYLRHHVRNLAQKHERRHPVEDTKGHSIQNRDENRISEGRNAADQSCDTSKPRTPCSPNGTNAVGRRKNRHIPAKTNHAYVEIVSTRRKPLVDIPGQRLPHHSSTGSFSMTPGTSAAAPPQPRDSPDAVRDFLAGLTPNMEHLLPYMKKIGIRSSECLKGMSTWPAKDCEAFMQEKLVDSGKADSFQIMSILIALKKLARDEI
ncbi:hypothetical protein NEOLEDRAFT_1176974 [Neolentinus lepideus HHB14362 ss-1]|uniref:Uncharacterized protein n=1 Tax=Neolentinus lepideus HHB14362 ss-1 TaxID=1314782 RepID=A0A165TUE6_9AGAM|nr:hypothetical protein NEOLEDRAFT_1176974 [Neolentinus lepideus HHB14362 ss-1]